jgi:hypothetical protein
MGRNQSPVATPFALSDEAATVTVRKVFTRMGERLEVTAEDLEASNRLDAIALESVTWQDADDLAAQAAELPRSGGTPDATPETERTDPITISSEFALAELTKVVDDGEERLRIRAPKLGYEIELGASELAWLATRTHETFTEWLKTPFGPDADDHDH